MIEPIVPASRYYSVFAALVVLTVLTVGISFLELGEWHTIAGLAIATGKALLVALVFMHLRHSKHLTWIVVGGGILWMCILMGLTLADYLTRSWFAY